MRSRSPGCEPARAEAPGREAAAPVELAVAPGLLACRRRAGGGARCGRRTAPPPPRGGRRGCGRTARKVPTAASWAEPARARRATAVRPPRVPFAAGGARRCPSPSLFFADLAAEAPQVPRGIHSQTLYDGPDLRLVLFAFAPGEELSEHTAARPAVVHVLDGEGDALVGGEPARARPRDVVPHAGPDGALDPGPDAAPDGALPAPAPSPDAGTRRPAAMPRGPRLCRAARPAVPGAGAPGRAPAPVHRAVPPRRSPLRIGSGEAGTRKWPGRAPWWGPWTDFPACARAGSIEIEGALMSSPRSPTHPAARRRARIAPAGVPPPRAARRRARHAAMPGRGSVPRPSVRLTGPGRRSMLRRARRRATEPRVGGHSRLPTSPGGGAERRIQGGGGDPGIGRDPRW